MKNIISLLTLLALCIFSYATPIASQVISGKVMDKDGAALEYVNIGLIGTSIGTVSGAGGAFQLFLKIETNEEALIRFSMVGYTARTFSVKEIKNTLDQNEGKIVLEASSILLNTITVSPIFTQTKTKGNQNTDANMMVKFAISKKPNQNLGAEIARKFLLPRKKKTQLNEMRFFINQNTFDTVRFRINIYELKKGKPAKNLVSSNIIKEVTGGQAGWISVDLEAYDLILESRRIAVGVEWIYSGGKGRFLNLPITFPSIGATHFYKYGSQAKWKRFRGMSSCIELKYSY